MASCQKIDRNEIKSIFAELDLDNNGMLDLDEFKQAMQQIGLTTNEVDKAFSIVSGIKRRKKWTDMSASVQSKWESLGWSESSWGGSSETSNLTWADLNESQQEAASALGYTPDVWDTQGGTGITFKMLLDAIQSASELQVTMTRVLTRQMSSLDKRSKVEDIREMMAQRESGRRRNADRIARIRNNRLGTNSHTPAPAKKVDSAESAQKRRQVDLLRAKYAIA